MNSTLPTPTTKLTKNNYVQALHHNKYKGYVNLIHTSLDEKNFLDKRNLLIHSNIYNTITQNHTSTVFYRDKCNVRTERPSSQNLFRDKSKLNDKKHPYVNKSSMNKSKQNPPIGSRSVTGFGIEEKKTHYHSQSSFTINLEVDKDNKRERRNTQKNHMNNHNCNYNVSRSTTTNNNNLTSKELFFSNGCSNPSSDNVSSNYNQFYLANTKQQQHSNNKLIISPLEKNITDYKINNQHSLIHLHDTDKRNERIKCESNYFGKKIEQNTVNKHDITLQSFSDSKMYEIANHYITTDESLDKYQVMSNTTKRKGGNYN